MKQQRAFEPKHNEMARHIASGIFNSGVVQTVRVLCQFGSVVILSRLLPPSDFGLMAMVSPVYGFVVLFQDLGLSQATIQKPGLIHGEVNAFFWINIAAGALLAALVIAVSPLVGWYYGDPRVVPLTSAMALLILVGSAGNQPGAILTRRMEFGVAAWTGVLGAIAGLAISIIMALIIKITGRSISGWPSARSFPSPACGLRPVGYPAAPAMFPACATCSNSAPASPPPMSRATSRRLSRRSQADRRPDT